MTLSTANLAPNTTPTATSERPQLSDVMFKKFAEMIYSMSGIRFQENKAYFLSSKLLNRCSALGLDSFEAYFSYLESPNGRTEYGHLIDEITINETFFYRHLPQLQAFQQEVLMPLTFLKKSKRDTRLRIWSCAASTGDEIYTIALIIDSLGLKSDFTIELVGTDICHDALEKARAGVYRKYAVRNIPQNILTKHFTHDQTTDTYLLSDEIKSMCKFQECNLMDSTRTSAIGKFDIAICRNVLIYFDEESKEKVLQNIANNLTEDSTLMLGHSENIYSQRHIFKQDKARSASISYTKQPPGTKKHTV